MGCAFLELCNSGQSMGARTINRKRSEECLTVNHSFSSPYSSDSRISKRARISSMPQSPSRTILTSSSTVSRISRYPEAKQNLVRELHAPCRTHNFDLAKSSNRELGLRTSGVYEKKETGSEMAKLLSSNLKRAKDTALDSFRYMYQVKEVMEVDTGSRKDVISEDSSIEEVEIIEDGREGRPGLTHQRWQGSAGFVTEIQVLDAEVVDGGLQQLSTSSMVSELTNSNLKVDNTEKMLESLRLEHDISDLHVYKKLIEAANMRTEKLNRLGFEIQLNEKKRMYKFDLPSPKKEPLKEVLKEPFVDLTEEEEAEVKKAFSANRKKVLVTHGNSNIEITGEIFQCLRPGAWLNDEVINVYLELLKEREKREPQKFLKCHFFNTFFYKKLISGRSGYDFKSVRRWTTQRKLGYSLIECDKIFVPIHKEIHWCLAIINKKDEKFEYLDSLKGRDHQVLKVLARYFVDEVKDKSGKDIDVSYWEKEFVEDLPEQENGFDCGMFMIKYADFYSRGLGLCFNQEHMPYFRRRTVKEILRLKAD